jgi:hypothetical protein
VSLSVGAVAADIPEENGDSCCSTGGVAMIPEGTRHARTRDLDQSEERAGDTRHGLLERLRAFFEAGISSFSRPIVLQEDDPAVGRVTRALEVLASDL